MPSTMELIYMIVIAGELTIGIWGNGFIILVNCIGYLKRRNMFLVDIILINLASSRIFFLCMISADGFVMVLSPDIYTCDKLMRSLDICWTVSNYLTVWHISCLSIFYLLKIANISHPLFLWLKQNISRVIFGILLGSFVISILVCVSVSFHLHDDFRYYSEDNNEENITIDLEVSNRQNAWQQVFLNLGGVVPFFLSLISFLLLLFSLFRHTKQMKLHATGSRDPSTEAHVRAIKAVLTFLILLIIYYITFLVITSSFLIAQRKLVVMLGGIIVNLFPSSHPFILIMGNSKLKDAFLKVLNFAKDFTTLLSMGRFREIPE